MAGGFGLNDGHSFALCCGAAKGKVETYDIVLLEIQSKIEMNLPKVTKVTRFWLFYKWIFDKIFSAPRMLSIEQNANKVDVKQNPRLQAGIDRLFSWHLHVVRTHSIREQQHRRFEEFFEHSQIKYGYRSKPRKYI